MNTPRTSTGTPNKASSPVPPGKVTTTVQGPKSRVCDKKKVIRFLVIAVGLAFVSVLVVTSVMMWMPQVKVELIY